MGKLYTVKEACEYLRVAKSTLYQMVHYKKISYTKIGGKLTFTEEILKKYVNMNTVNVDD